MNCKICSKILKPEEFGYCNQVLNGNVLCRKCQSIQLPKLCIKCKNKLTFKESVFCYSALSGREKCYNCQRN